MSIANELGAFLKNNKLTIATAESCTAGLIAGKIADVPGSSAWLDSGFVVYTPEAKNRILGVNYETIKTFNITSTEVSDEMVLGVLKNNSNLNLVIAVTGVAGPGGGTDDIPVGTVCISWLYNIDGITIEHERVLFDGNRNEIRAQTVEYALSEMLHTLKNNYFNNHNLSM